MPTALRLFRNRDFRLLWIAMAVSYLGDGVYMVAIAFQAYALSGSPSTLSFVGVAWSLGLVSSVLAGGVLADRFPRRRMMIVADAVRFLALTVAGLLSVSSALTVPALVALAGLYGIGEGLFAPAFGAVVPDLVRDEEVGAANAVQQFLQPAAMLLLGPVVGGLVVGAVGPGGGLLADAGTFVFSTLCLLGIRTSTRPPRRAESSVRVETGEAIGFVRETPWLGATLVAVAIAVLVFSGPLEVLLPFRVKNELGGTAADFGVVLAAAGVGALLGASFCAWAGEPDRPVPPMYLCWILGCLPVAGYGVANQIWMLLPLAAIYGFAMAIGDVLWGTMTQRWVPVELRGRVSSLDWFVSLALIPVSFALAGPLAAILGTQGALILAGVGGSAAIAGVYLLVPALREASAPRAPVEEPVAGS